MTHLQTKALAQCIQWCEVDQKAHAWKLAKELAEIDPHQLADLPQMLTKAMLAKGSTQQSKSTDQ